MQHRCSASDRNRSAVASAVATCLLQCIVAMPGVDDLLLDSSTHLTAAAPAQEVNDPVHGSFFLGPLPSLASGAAAVQRLRHLKQLGPTGYGPYPAAVHTRYEHSLSCAHLAERCLLHLAAGGTEDVRQLDMELTALAGLCHDLGHGPFSHSFDTFLHSILGPQYHWQHEAMSCRLLEAVLSEAQLDLDSQQVKHVQDLIDNSQHRHLRQPLQPDQAWRLQVVSNAVNGLDVDKVDYLVRDSMMAGVSRQQLDVSHFIPLVTQHCKVLSGHLCYDQRQQQHVAALYDARAFLHDRVYQHPQAKAAELVIADALAAAEPVLQIADRVDDPEAFMALTDDSVTAQIHAAAGAKGAHPCMREAAGILQRLQQPSTLYQLAAEAELPAQADMQHEASSSSSSRGPGTASSSRACSSGQLSVDDLISCQQSGGGLGGVTLKAGDLRLQHYNINYCFGEEDPLDRVFLYDASSCSISKKACDGLDRSATRFLSSRVRVYLARPCASAAERQAYAAAAAAAFRSALQARCGRQHWRLLEDRSSKVSTSGQDLRSAAAALLLQRAAGCKEQAGSSSSMFLCSGEGVVKCWSRGSSS